MHGSMSSSISARLHLTISLRPIAMLVLVVLARGLATCGDARAQASPSQAETIAKEAFIWADLRAEPLVLGVPEIEKGRYYSLQFVDLYTYNFAYVGTRTTGNGEGKFLLAGPGWKGEVPTGIKKVIRSDTEFVFVGYRTQLFKPE